MTHPPRSHSEIVCTKVDGKDNGKDNILSFIVYCNKPHEILRELQDFSAKGASKIPFF